MAPVSALRDAASPPPDSVAAAAAVVDDLSDTLARWFGPYGYHALLTRALARAQAAHAALAGVAVRAPVAPVLDGLADAAAAHGASAVTAGLAAVVSSVIDLLGRVIGEDMAQQLTAPVVERRADGAVERAVPNGVDSALDPSATRPGWRSIDLLDADVP